MTTAREIMTSGAECVRDYESILVAAEKMAAHGVGALPICGSDDRLKGVLTDRDIAPRGRPGPAVPGAGQVTGSAGP